MAKHEAVFIEAECSQYNQKFYLRYDYAADDVWVQTYGVKEKERSARASGQSRSIDMSQTRTGPQYRCPYCGNEQFDRKNPLALPVNVVLKNRYVVGRVGN